ncbi:MAG TPA: Nif3-like dinuclear metal center hexameric protein [Vicinamibacterales bacterium]|nr:Nif3-like dinuclear metal center hexameric protein [Vicinamibacterales bacterium]
MTAGDVVERIRKNVGVPWREATYRDTFKAGGPATPVTGIATTAFASFDVIRRAVAEGLNMIVPHEVTFWNDRDDVAVVKGDPLYTQKIDFLTRNNVVVFRMHDHMHDQRPDFLYIGSARELGLDAKHETAPGSHRFTIPETTLGRLAADVKKRVGARALRVAGDPNARVSRIQLGVGYATPSVNDAAVDVVISGEQQEVDGGFDNPEYVLDAAALGIPKGWIMLGHAVSEEAGMLEMAQWIRGFVTEVPVRLVKAGEPFWAPQ